MISDRELILEVVTGAEVVSGSSDNASWYRRNNVGSQSSALAFTCDFPNHDHEGDTAGSHVVVAAGFLVCTGEENGISRHGSFQSGLTCLFVLAMASGVVVPGGSFQLLEKDT